jgi:hypothetical protein
LIIYSLTFLRVNILLMGKLRRDCSPAESVTTASTSCFTAKHKLKCIFKNKKKLLAGRKQSKLTVVSFTYTDKNVYLEYGGLPYIYGDRYQQCFGSGLNNAVDPDRDPENQKSSTKKEKNLSNFTLKDGCSL